MENRGHQICKKCNGIGLPSKALDNTFVSFHDFGNDAGQRGTTMSKVGPAKMIACLKCKDCGHSWVPAKLRPAVFKEDLFKSYISKFSKEEKLKAINIITSMIN